MVNGKCCVWCKFEFFSPELIDCVSLTRFLFLTDSKIQTQIFSREDLAEEKTMMEKEVKKNLEFAEMEKKVGFDGHGLSV